MSNGLSDGHERHLAVLRKISACLADGRVSWALTGSLGMALQGVPVPVGDIDLQTDKAGAYEIERRLAGQRVRPVRFSASTRVRSHYGCVRVDGIQVEIIGDIETRRPDGTWEPPPDLAAHTRVVEAAGMRIPVLSLAYEVQAYARLGRADRAEMLQKWLARDAGDTEQHGGAGPFDDA